MTGRDMLLAGAWVMIAVLTLALAATILQVRQLTSRTFRPTLDPQRLAAAIRTEDRGDTALIIVLGSSDCSRCGELLAAVQTRGEHLRLRFAFLYSDAGPAEVPTGVVVQRDQSLLFELLGVETLPYVVLFDEHGATVFQGPIGSVERFEDVQRLVTTGEETVRV